jgi:hypothetical protein
MSIVDFETKESPIVRQPQAAWRIDDWGYSVGISRMSVYNLMTKGLVKSVKCGRARLIVTSPADFVASLPSV